MIIKPKLFTLFLLSFCLSPVFATTNFVVTSEIPIKTNPSPYIVDFIDRVKELSDGELVGQYFQAGQLYTDTEALAALGTGTVQFVFPVSTRLEQMDKRTGILNLPFMINYHQMTSQCFQQELTSMTSEYLEQANIEILGFLRTAELIFLMAEDPVDEVEDLNGKRIRLVGGTVMQNAMRSVGSSPISMAASEMAVAMSQGAIDGAMTSPAGWAHVLGRAAKYGVLFPGMSLATSAIAVDGQWYNSLPAELKASVDKAVHELIERQWTETVEKDRNLILQMKEQGGIYTEIKSPEVDKMKEKFLDANSSFTSRYPSVYKKYQEISKNCTNI